MSLNSLHNGNFEALGGAMARATWAWQPLRGSPWVLKYLIVTKSSPKPILGATEGFHETSNFKNLHVPLNSLSALKTAKSSLARGHIGGGDSGYLELGPGTPAMG